MKIGLDSMIKYDERLTRISQEEYLQIIRDNANTMAIITGTNPTGGLDSADWVSKLFAEADRYKESLGPWEISSNGLYFLFRMAQGGGYKIRVEDDLKNVRRYYFKNEEHHLLIRVARNSTGETAFNNYSPVRVSVLKYFFEE